MKYTDYCRRLALYSTITTAT